MYITAIGFSNKYYTLWHIEEETRPLSNGCNYMVTHYTYIKNISFDKETALAKYPDAVIDENLRGKTKSWSSKPKEVWNNVDVFRFGKYKFHKIDKVNDIQYISWYWDNIYDEKHKEYVENLLINNGYEVRTYSDGDKYLMSPEDLEIEREEINRQNSIINKINNNEELSFVSSYNPDLDGEIVIDNITYRFDEVAEYSYDGIPYYLPILNGKAKRIKNKKVIIKKYETIDLNDNGYIVVKIKDFIIEK